MSGAAVVVSFNSADDLPACLGALRRATDLGQLVVVDNASEDGSVRAAHGWGAEVLALDRNTGFAGGCNRGWRAVRDARPEWVSFLNPDVVVEPDCLAKCGAALTDGVGGVAPRLMRADGRTVDSVGQLLRRPTLEVGDRGYGQPMVPELMVERDVLAACGALAVFSPAALDAAGGRSGPWAEHYFCFWEDLELGWRLHNLGLRVVAAPGAVALHGRGAGARRGRGPLRWRRPATLEACVISNRWMTLIRHLHPLDLATRAPLLLSWDLLLLCLSVARRPGLVRHLGQRWPLVLDEWRRRAGRPRKRLAELPW
jgi:GT2 family glycosyltransferase